MYVTEIHRWITKLKDKIQKKGEMGVLIKLVEAILFFFFLVIAIEVPVLNAQVCLPSKFFPGFLVDLYLWYSREFVDYLFVEKPPFFIGLMWLELLIQWPLSILNLYSICRRKSWFNTTCLVYGSSAFTTTKMGFEMGVDIVVAEQYKRRRRRRREKQKEGKRRRREESGATRASK
ncbi:hypothetical protein ACSBR1_028230 [Camellia fascicularis]